MELVNAIFLITFIGTVYKACMRENAHWLVYL